MICRHPIDPLAGDADMATSLCVLACDRMHAHGGESENWIKLFGVYLNGDRFINHLTL